MATTYITEGGELAQPDESEQQLHEYHTKIEDKIGVDIIGLTGRGGRIRRLSFRDKLSEKEQSDIEAYLGVSLVIDDVTS